MEIKNSRSVEVAGGSMKLWQPLEFALENHKSKMRFKVASPP
jgi:hypothetical protein